MVVPLYMLGRLAIHENDYIRANAWFSECLLFNQQLGMNFLLSQCLIALAGIASTEKRFGRAAQLLGASELQLGTGQFPQEKGERAELNRLTTFLREELGDVEFEALAAKGRAMTMEQAIAYALEDNGS
jgi:hypothetical protein